FDVDKARLSDLRGRTRRLGLQCVRVHENDFPDVTADVVLVDAPCSSLGTLRRSPDLRWHLGALDHFPTTQREILQRAATCVKPGGALVYVTCTLRRAENQEVAAWFTQTHHAFVRISEQVLLPH